MRKLTAVAILILASACSDPGVGESAGPQPKRFVGVSTDGSVVVANTADGSTVREVMGAHTDSQKQRTVQLLDDGKTLFVWTRSDKGCGLLQRTSIDGGPTETVLENVRGWSVTGDGSALAYTEGPYISDGSDCGEPLTVVVRDLTDGTERRWLRQQSPDDLQAGVASLFWLSAPRYLGWVSCGADSCGPATLDTTVTGSLDDATIPLEGNPDANKDVGLSPDWFPASIAMRGALGTMVFSVNYSSTSGEEKYPIVEADALTKVPKRALFTARGRPLDFDATGTYMLFLDEGLSWWSAGDRTIPISDGFVDADW